MELFTASPSKLHPPPIRIKDHSLHEQPVTIAAATATIRAKPGDSNVSDDGETTRNREVCFYEKTNYVEGATD